MSIATEPKMPEISNKNAQFITILCHQPSLFLTLLLHFHSIPVRDPFKPFYRPARLKPVQIDKASGSIHWYPSSLDRKILLLFTAESKDIYYRQYAQRIDYKQHYKPGEVVISACSPQGDSLPCH